MLIKQILKDTFSPEKLEEIYYGWDNEGVLYGWENGVAGEIIYALKKEGYNIDSIKVMNEAFNELSNIVESGR